MPPAAGFERRKKAGCASGTDSACPHVFACTPAGGGLLSRIPASGIVVEPGQHLPYVIVVRSAFLRSYLVERGQQKTVGFHFPGETIVLRAYADPELRPGIEALAEGEVCLLPVRRVRESWDAGHLQATIGGEYSALLAATHILGRPRALQKVAAFMLSLMRRAPVDRSRRCFNACLRRQDIAEYLGLQMETISRVLSQLRRDGVLDFADHVLTVKDVPVLEALAGGQRASEAGKATSARPIAAVPDQGSAGEACEKPRSGRRAARAR